MITLFIILAIGFYAAAIDMALGNAPGNWWALPFIGGIASTAIALIAEFNLWGKKDGK